MANAPMTPELKAALSLPHVAFPTLAVLLLSVFGWCAAVVLIEAGFFSYGLVTMTLSAYVAFTPMHDAAHRSVAKAAWVNALVGRSCATMLGGPFPAFRFVHLEHHKHTNDPEKDPDLWSGLGPTWLLPLRWLTQDLHYYVGYLARLPSEWIETSITVFILLSCLAALMLTGHSSLVLAWVVSSRLALAALAFGFDYLPHRPHTVLGKDNRYAATSVRLGALWQFIFMNQNLHLVHHLHPAAPFYRYGALWRTQEAALRANGVQVVNERRENAVRARLAL